MAESAARQGQMFPHTAILQPSTLQGGGSHHGREHPGLRRHGRPTTFEFSFICRISEISMVEYA